MSVRKSNRTTTRAQGLRHTILELISISSHVSVLIVFLQEITPNVEEYDEAIDTILNFQYEISKSSRKLTLASKISCPNELLDKLSGTSMKIIISRILQSSMDAMATADSMYHTFRNKEPIIDANNAVVNNFGTVAHINSRNQLISGLWGTIFLFASNAAEKLYEIDVDSHKNN